MLIKAHLQHTGASRRSFLLYKCLQGCPSDQVKAVLTRLPALSQKFAKYWICQARLLEQDGNLDRVLPMFEEAVAVVMEVSEKNVHLYLGVFF